MQRQSVSVSGGEPYYGIAPIFDAAVEWLAGRRPGSTATLEAVERARRSGGWRLSLERRFGFVYGVSLVGAGGEWFLDAADEVAALRLAAFAVRDPRGAGQVVCSAEVREWVRPALERCGG